MIIIPIIILLIPIVVVGVVSYRDANYEDQQNRVINTMVAHNGAEEWIYVGSICDPQPFDWDSALHMMLPNEIADYIKEDI